MQMPTTNTRGRRQTDTGDVSKGLLGLRKVKVATKFGEAAPKPASPEMAARLDKLSGRKPAPPKPQGFGKREEVAKWGNDHLRTIEERQAVQAKARRRARTGGNLATLGFGAFAVGGVRGGRVPVKAAGRALKPLVHRNESFGALKMKTPVDLRLREAGQNLKRVGDKMSRPDTWRTAGAATIVGGAALNARGNQVERDQQRKIFARRKELRARAKTEDLAKRARTYDAEDQRQRRLGGAIALTGVGGTAALARGGRNTLKFTRALRNVPHDLPNMSKEKEVALHQLRGTGLAVRPKDVGLMAAGAAGVGTAARLEHSARRDRSRRYV